MLHIPGVTVFGCIYTWKNCIWLYKSLKRQYLVVFIPGKNGIWLYKYLERQYLAVYIPGETVSG